MSNTKLPYFSDAAIETIKSYCAKQNPIAYTLHLGYLGKNINEIMELLCISYETVLDHTILWAKYGTNCFTEEMRQKQDDFELEASFVGKNPYWYSIFSKMYNNGFFAQYGIRFYANNNSEPILEGYDSLANVIRAYGSALGDKRFMLKIIDRIFGYGKDFHKKQIEIIDYIITLTLQHEMEITYLYLVMPERRHNGYIYIICNESHTTPLVMEETIKYFLRNSEGFENGIFNSINILLTPRNSTVTENTYILPKIIDFLKTSKEVNIESAKKFIHFFTEVYTDDTGKKEKKQLLTILKSYSK